MVKKEFECSGCKDLPRPGQATIKKCKTCSKIFCGTCGIRSHQCSDGKHCIPQYESVPLKIDLKFLPYFCKNSKFGCEEILFKDSELFEHEHDCVFQIVCCPDFSCKNEVNFVNYLDHFKEKHDNHEDLGEGKTFKLPLPMDEIQSQTLKISLKNDVLSSKSKFQGKYQISDVVNGKPSWIMNSHAIWYYNDDVNIGLKEFIGKNHAYIYASNVARGPDDSSNVWMYNTSSEKDYAKAGENDVRVQSLSEKGKNYFNFCVNSLVYRIDNNLI